MTTYHPALRPLYVHFVTTTYSVCAPFVMDPDELTYVVAACWPGFVKPVLDAWEARKEEKRRRLEEDEDENDEEMNGEDDDAELKPPGEDTRLRLTRLFTPLITQALEALYPRLTSARAWLDTHVPPPNLLSYPPRELPALLSAATKKNSHKKENEEETLKSLPRMAKFILVAAFLASTNPAKTDVRMFGRVSDEASRRKGRRKGGSPKKMSAKHAAVKVRSVPFLAFPHL